jgi:hypothetical protein
MPKASSEGYRMMEEQGPPKLKAKRRGKMFTRGILSLLCPSTQPAHTRIQLLTRLTYLLTTTHKKGLCSSVLIALCNRTKPARHAKDKKKIRLKRQSSHENQNQMLHRCWNYQTNLKSLNF